MIGASFERGKLENNGAVNLEGAEKKQKLENGLELPTDSGESIERCDLPDDSGDSIERCELPDDSGNEMPEDHVEEDDKNSKTPKIDIDGIKKSDVPEKNNPIQNKADGLRREADVHEQLKKVYPSDEGYSVVSEVYLRDADGNIVKDSETGKARRIDFVVVKDGKVIDSVEVTSKTADKTEQMNKENRIRKDGGTYIRDNDGCLIKIPDDVVTRIERRD